MLERLLYVVIASEYAKKVSNKCFQVIENGLVFILTESLFSIAN